MEDLITKITEMYFEQKEKIEELDKEFAKAYEERIIINNITKFVQTYGIQTLEDIDKEIENCNKKIREVASYNTYNLKDEKKTALERIKELKKYKEYIEKNNKDNKKVSELLNDLRINSIKKTDEQHKQQTQMLSIIKNLKEVCDDRITELKHENGESVDLSEKLSRLDSVQKRINGFDIYNGILSNKNKMELEKLETTKKMLIEDIKGKIPDLGAMIRNSVEQEMYAEKKTEVSEKLKENRLQISQFISIKQNLQNIEEQLLQNSFSGLIREINQQETNVKRIEMKQKDDEIKNETATFKGPELSEELTEQIEKIIQEPIEEPEIQDKVPVVTPAELKQMEEIINNIPKEPITELKQEENKTGIVSDEELQKYLFDEKNIGGEPIVPELPDNRFEEIINKVKQNKAEHSPNKVEQNDETRIKYKSELENIRKYLAKQENKSDEIDKKVKRKTLKQLFREKAKKVLKKIGDYFVEEERFEEENALLEQEIQNEGTKGRVK